MFFFKFCFLQCCLKYRFDKLSCFQYFEAVKNYFLCLNRAVRLFIIMLALMSIKNRHTKRRLGGLFDMTLPHRCKVTDLPKWKSV